MRLPVWVENTAAQVAHDAMAKAKNIRSTELRSDYLSCYGHKALHTPHIDRLAETLRDSAICEYDNSASPVAAQMNASVRDAVMLAAIDKKRKLIHFEGGFHPLQFDLQTGPLELVDLGARGDQAKIIADKYHKLFTWTRRQSQRTTRSEAQRVDRPIQGGGVSFWECTTRMTPHLN